MKCILQILWIYYDCHSITLLRSLYLTFGAYSDSNGCHLNFVHGAMEIGGRKIRRWRSRFRHKRSWNGTREPIFYKVGFEEKQNGNWDFKLLGNNGGDNILLLLLLLIGVYVYQFKLLLLITVHISGYYWFTSLFPLVV